MDSNVPIRPEQVLYGQLEDAEIDADKLNPAAPHRSHEMAAERAEQACHDLAEHFLARGAGWRLRLARYRETATWGE